MNRRGIPLFGALLLIGLLSPTVATAQTPAPLAATLAFDNPPADVTFGPCTPIKINLILSNVSGAPIITVAGFSSTEFWRNLYFELEGVGTVTDASASTVHAFTPFGTCHYRRSVLLPGAGIQVAPVEVVPQTFAVQFSFADARTFFDLSRPGRYTVNARIGFSAYTAGAIIDDCNIEFGRQSLLSIGDIATVGRQEFHIVSNSLEFIVPSDTTAPTTTVLASPAPNAAGWNAQNVSLAFTAADNSGGTGVNRIAVSLAGAQTGSQIIPGASGSVAITTQGVTTVTYDAVDNANNAEAAHSLTVRIDKAPPAVTPPTSVTVTATEATGARGSASAALATFLAGGTAADDLDPAPARLVPQTNGAGADNTTLFPIGTTTVVFSFRDRAGNVGSATATVNVVPGDPAISVAIAASGVKQGRVFFYDLRFTNTGTGVGRSVTLQNVTITTLSGQGKPRYNADQSPTLPVALGDIAVGASKTVRIYVTVPSAVKKFSMTESGQATNSSGARLSYSSSQTVTP
jgi:hypothetical protein